MQHRPRLPTPLFCTDAVSSLGHAGSLSAACCWVKLQRGDGRHPGLTHARSHPAVPWCQTTRKCVSPSAPGSWHRAPQPLEFPGWQERLSSQQGHTSHTPGGAGHEQEHKAFCGTLSSETEGGRSLGGWPVRMSEGKPTIGQRLRQPPAPSPAGNQGGQAREGQLSRRGPPGPLWPLMRVGCRWSDGWAPCKVRMAEGPVTTRMRRSPHIHVSHGSRVSGEDKTTHWVSPPPPPT